MLNPVTHRHVHPCLFEKQHTRPWITIYRPLCQTTCRVSFVT